MKTCKDCIHNSVCSLWRREEGQDAKFYAETEDGECEHFKDKSRFVELPCKVGDTAYWISRRYGKCEVIPREVDSVECHSNGRWRITSTEDWLGEWLGETVFLTPADAEKEIERIKHEHH